MPWRFEGCRERIKRAQAHYDALAEVWNTTPIKDLYTSTVQVEDDGTGGIWMSPHEDSTIFNTAALQFGEFLYQLRSALDGCVYQAAVIDSGSDPPPDEEHLEFPICLTSSHFKKKAAFALAPLADKRRALIESVQPYNTRNVPADELVFDINRTLGILSDWARKDRHRKLHLVGALPAKASPKLRYPEGVSLVYMKVFGSAMLEHKSQIASFALSGYRRGMKIEANPDVMLDIAIDEIPPPSSENDTFGQRITEMINAVYSVVAAIEDSF